MELYDMNNKFDKSLQIIKLTDTLKLYIKIQIFMEQEIDVHFALNEINNDNIIELTNFRDKTGKSIIAKFTGAKIVEKKDNSFQIKIDSMEIVKIQFKKENLKMDYDFSEIYFDVIYGDDVYSLKVDYKLSLNIL